MRPASCACPTDPVRDYSPARGTPDPHRAGIHFRPVSTTLIRMTVITAPAPRPIRSPRRRLLTRVVCWSFALALVTIGVIATVATAYLAAATVDSIAVLMTIASLAGAATGAAAGTLLAPGLGLIRRTGAAVLAGLVMLTGTGLLTLAATDGRVSPPGPSAADPRGPHEMWQLPTGSGVAVWRRAAEVPRHRTPVVFLHGGPGMYTQASKFAEGAPLRAAGFNTVYFDQAGAGASARLPVDQYTFTRAIADVEALRVRLGAQRLVLWGNSYGAQLATAYAATYPDRVAGLLLTSPGTFPGVAAQRDYTLTNRSEDTELSGRLLLATLLMERNPALAEDLVEQAEAGAMLDAVTARELAGGFVCRGADAGTLAAELADGRGGNLFVNRMLPEQVETFRLPRTSVDVPMLVVRGGCDFVPRSNAERYLAFASPAQIIDVPRDGHGLRLNRPTVDDAVARFAATQLASIE